MEGWHDIMMRRKILCLFSAYSSFFDDMVEEDFEAFHVAWRRVDAGRWGGLCKIGVFVFGNVTVHVFSHGVANIVSKGSGVFDVAIGLAGSAIDAGEAAKFGDANILGRGSVGGGVYGPVEKKFCCWCW
jgi:hypothetical protein